MEHLIDAVKANEVQKVQPAAEPASEIEKQTLALFQSRTRRDPEETPDDPGEDERYYWKG